MKVCRWKNKPAVVCFVIVLSCLIIAIYKALCWTTDRGASKVFVRGAHSPSSPSDRDERPYVEYAAHLNVDGQQRNASHGTDMASKSSATILRQLVVHLDLKGAPLRANRFRAFFEYFSKLGATGILIEWEDMFPYKGELKQAASSDAYSVEDVKGILRDAADFGLEVIPLVQTIGHLEWVLKLPAFDELRELAPFPQAICISNDRAVKLVQEMISQVMALHGDARFVHIGGDEVYQYGECDRCAERLKNERLSREDLVVKHINTVARFVVNNYKKRVLIWHDFLVNVPPETVDKYNLKTVVEPVVWNYAEDVHAYMPPTVWTSFANFDYMWVSSAFKGADGPTRFHSNVQHYLKNHIGWINELNTVPPNYKKFRGMVFTGWQRYDHLSGLCELLPVGIPSLTVDMLTIQRGGHDEVVNRRSLEMLRCLSGSDILGELYGCSFPGSEVYSAVQTLYKTIEETENNLLNSHSIQGWLSTYNINNNVSSPWLLKSVLPEIESYRWQLKSISDVLRKALSPLYFPNTVDEFLATYVDPIRLKLEHLNRKGVELMAQKNFPVRPFPIQRNID